MFGPRTGAITRHSMLPLLIKVFAGFTRVDDKIEEWEIDSALGFLRYDFPAAVYSELRDLYRVALREDQDLESIAGELEKRLSAEDKILLGVQLYALIYRSLATDLNEDHLTAFYGFMQRLGVADEAIDIVYQLNASEMEAFIGTSNPDWQLDTLVIGPDQSCDVSLPGLETGHLVVGFRLRRLILLKNIGEVPVIMRGRTIPKGEFVRLFEGQQILQGEIVLDYDDIVFFFNAKQQNSDIQVYLSSDKEGATFLEPSRSRETSLDLSFGLGVKVTAIKGLSATLNGLRLDQGTTVEASLDDRIIFDDFIFFENHLVFES